MMNKRIDHISPFVGCIKKSFSISSVALLTLFGFSVLLPAQQKAISDGELHNDDLLKQYVMSKGKDIVVFDASNIKQFWIDNSVASQNDLIHILLKEKQASSFESVPLKIQLINVHESLDCKVEVIAKTPDTSFSVKNSGSRILSVSSPEKDFVQYHVSSATFQLDKSDGLSFFLCFSSKISDSVSIAKIVLSFSANTSRVTFPLSSAADGVGEKIESEDPNSQKRTIEFPAIQSLPKDEKAAKQRKEHIRNEIARIENELKKHGGSFDAWKKEYAPIAERYGKLCNEGYKGWVNGSYYAAGTAETTYNTRDFIKGILPYKKYLEENNIDLIVLRIPGKGDFAARVLASDVFQENPAWIEHYYECLKNNIEIVDPMPEMWKHRFDYPLFYFATDNYPAEGLAIVSAEVLSENLKRYDYKKSEIPINLENMTYETTQPRYFWPAGNDKYNPKGNIVFKHAVRNNQAIGGPKLNSGSPFLFLSSSFLIFPMLSQGASLPSYTAHYIQAIPDWFSQDGLNGNAVFKNLISSSSVLSNRNALILGVSPNDWKEFRSFPKNLSDKAKSACLEKTFDSLNDIADSPDFVFSKEASGGTEIRKKNNFAASFYVNIDIPPVQGKKTCMLRINLGKSTYLSFSVSRKDNTVIDSGTQIRAGSPYADLFIPVDGDSESVVLKVETYAASSAFSIKNIELWYY